MDQSIRLILPSETRFSINWNIGSELRTTTDGCNFVAAQRTRFSVVLFELGSEQGKRR